MASKIASKSLRLVVAFVSVLIFKGIHAVTDLDFTQEPSDAVVLRNQPLTLNCAVTGLPPLTVKWLLNGQTIGPTADRQASATNSLFLPSVLPKRDSGEYQCCVSNEVGRICSCPATVTVANVPRYTIVKLPSAVQRGGVFRLECLSEGAVPIPEVMWRRGKEVITADERRTILPSGVLQVSQVTDADAGNYRCFTEMGDRRIKSPALSVPAAAAPSALPPAGGRPPVFVAPPRPQQVRAGEVALLECFADGDSLQVTWRRDDQQPIRTQGVNYLGQGNLQLQGVTVADEAVYNCTAENLASGESVQAQAQLVVMVPPTFRVVPEDFFGPLGSTARFSCEATGRPAPTIRWLHNGNPQVLSERVVHKDSDDLLFNRLVKEDMGMVQCVAENEAGSIQVGAKLKIRIVEDVLDPPKNIHLVSISPSTVMITWDSPTIKDGLEVLAYTVHYKAVGRVLELQQILEVSPTTAYITNLSPHTNYSFYMFTWTKEMPSNASKRYYIVTEQSRPSVAPSFTVASNSPTSVTLNWQPVPLEYRHGVIIKYRIRVRTDDASQDTFVDDMALSEYTVEGLLSGQIYRVCMAAATDKGFGANSAWVTVHTQVVGDLRPQAPHFEVKRLNLTSLSICPAPQQPSDMNVLGLKLFVSLDGAGPGATPDPILLPLNTTEYVITGLEPDTTYIIRLLTYTVFSDGYDTIQDITTGSQPGIPNPEQEEPTGIAGVALSSRIIRLAWHVPVTSQRITRYTVHYWQQNNRSKMVQPIELDLEKNGTVGEVLIHGLDPFTLYEFDMCAISSEDVGLFCETIAVKTLEDRPSTPPEDVLAKSLDSHAVELQWQPPMEPNGIITHYVILYNQDVSKPEENWNQQARNGTAHHSTVDGLTSDTRYYFKVRAGTQVGEGPPTNAVAAQTLTAKGSGVATWPWQKSLPIGVCLAIVLIITLVIFIFIYKKRGILTMASTSATSHTHSNDSAICMGYTAGGSPDGRMYVMGKVEEKGQNGFTPMMSVLPQPRNLDTKGGTPLIINGNGPVRHHHHFPNGGIVIPSRFPRSSGPFSGDPDASSLALLPGSESVTNSDLGEDNSQGKSEASSSSGGFTPYSQEFNHRTAAASMQHCCLPSKLPQCSSCCLGPCPQLSDSSTGSYGEPVIPGPRVNRVLPPQPAPPHSQPQGRRAAHTGVNISCSDGERPADGYGSDGRSPPPPATLPKSELTWPRHTGRVVGRHPGGASGGEGGAETVAVWERQTPGCEESPCEQAPLRSTQHVADDKPLEPAVKGEDTSPDFLTKVLDEMSSGSCSTAV